MNVAIIGLAALLLLVQQPNQVQRCVPTLDAMTKQLKAVFGELPFVIGGIPDQRMPGQMLLYVNPDDFSWTFVTSSPVATCITSTGKDLRPSPIGTPS